MSDENKDLPANDDLLKLLNEISSEDPIVPETPKTIKVKEQDIIPEIPQPVRDEEVHPKRKVASLAPIEAAVTQVQPEDNGKYVREVLQDFSGLSKTIIGRFEEDRREIQEVLDFLKDKVYNSPDGKEGVGEEYVNALANTLRTKSDASSNAVRLLDSYSKLLSSGKSAIGGGGGGAGATKDMLELAKLLTRDAYPDEQ